MIILRGHRLRADLPVLIYLIAAGLISALWLAVLAWGFWRLVGPWGIIGGTFLMSGIAMAGIIWPAPRRPRIDLGRKLVPPKVEPVHAIERQQVPTGGYAMSDSSRRHFLGISAAISARLATGAAIFGIGISAARAQHHHHLHCFLRGTLIATPEGDAPVENLQEDDWIWTERGETRLVGIEKRFFYRVDSRWPVKWAPIRINAEAITGGSPRQTLYVSPTHRVFLDGALYPAERLVNDISIVRDTSFAHPVLEYYNLVLPKHHIIIANGALMESHLAKGMTPCAPIHDCNGGRSEIAALARRCISPMVDVRNPIQRAQDTLAARALVA